MGIVMEQMGDTSGALERYSQALKLIADGTYQGQTDKLNQEKNINGTLVDTLTVNSTSTRTEARGDVNE